MLYVKDYQHVWKIESRYISSSEHCNAVIPLEKSTDVVRRSAMRKIFLQRCLFPSWSLSNRELFRR
jgi:hypothetical protein